MIIKRVIILFSVCFLNCLFANQSNIIKVSESKNILEVTKSIIKIVDTKKNIVVLDLDNTVFQCAQELGNEQWFNYKLNHYQEREGLSSSKALNKTLKDYAHIQISTSVKLVDKNVKYLFETIRKNNIPLIAVTSRGYENSLWTFEQLKSLGLSFEDTALSYNNQKNKKIESIGFDHPDTKKDHYILYRKGVLFTTGGNKGTLLFTLLNKLKYSPDRVFFVDDKIEHVQNMKQACLERGVSLYAWRYGYLDEQVRAFNPKITEIQSKIFLGNKNEILSDAHALEMIKKYNF